MWTGAILVPALTLNLTLWQPELSLRFMSARADEELPPPALKLRRAVKIPSDTPALCRRKAKGSSMQGEGATRPIKALLPLITSSYGLQGTRMILTYKRFNHSGLLIAPGPHLRFEAISDRD
ncbi:hypothetical protein V2G26_015739 [Clonostachys chloroleuca]